VFDLKKISVVKEPPSKRTGSKNKKVFTGGLLNITENSLSDKKLSLGPFSPKSKNFK
jgi:hypothetical protein